MSMFANLKPLDRRLIADAVETEMLRQYGSWAQMEREALHYGGPRRPVSRATLKRVARADANVSRAAFARVESMLWLPPGTLEAIGEHDLETLRQFGIDSSLMVWITARIKKIQAERQSAQA